MHNYIFNNYCNNNCKGLIIYIDKNIITIFEVPLVSYIIRIYLTCSYYSLNQLKKLKLKNIYNFIFKLYLLYIYKKL